jgi:tripartite-type tricarboxylate transporter receptor subunit TctC
MGAGKHFLACVLLTATIANVGSALGQDYPSRRISLVVPYSPGSTPDIVARVVGKALGAALPVPVVVENRPGAGGNIAARFVASQPADGYTVMVTAMGTLSVNQWLYKALPYDPEKDFTPVNNLVGVPNMLVVGPQAKVGSVKELIAAAKAKPNHLNYGSSGLGTSLHLCMEMIKAEAGVDLVHVPYKGSADAVADLLGSRIDVICSNIPPVLPMVRDGRLSALATTGRTRHPLAPNLPTVSEAGLPGFESVAWIGAVAPAGLPQNIQNKLHVEISKVLSDPKVAKDLVEMGLIVMNQGPQEFTKYIADETVRWKKIITNAGLLHQQ